MKSSYIVNEGISSQELADVLFRRLEARYPDIVTNHGHEVVGDAVQNVASFHAGAGTGDIGIMLRQILKQLDQSANKIDEQDISEAVPAKPDPFVFKSLNAADAYFRAVTHGDGMDVVTRYGKGDAGAYRQYLSKFVKPELDEQDWSTLPGHGSQKDTFNHRAAFAESEGQPRVRKYTKERPDGTMMVRYEVLDHKGYRIPGQGPEGFDDLSTAKKFLRDKSFDLMAQRESKSAILSGVLLSK